MTAERAAVGIEEALRERLARVADGLIPPGDGMPAPSCVDIGGRQLDAVLTSRPDLAEGLRRALEAAGEVEDSIGWVEAFRAEDPGGYDALVTAIVAGYYMHPEVMRLLRYPGQVPQQVSVAGFPDYADEGLLERVYERGPIYRPTPEDTAPERARSEPG
jgi:hypothetical protein